jgi:hypothetical protein
VKAYLSQEISEQLLLKMGRSYLVALLRKNF